MTNLNLKLLSYKLQFQTTYILHYADFKFRHHFYCPLGMTDQMKCFRSICPFLSFEHFRSARMLSDRSLPVNGIQIYHNIFIIEISVTVLESLTKLYVYYVYIYNLIYPR